jgi:hypothetical protein
LRQSGPLEHWSAQTCVLTADSPVMKQRTAANAVNGHRVDIHSGSEVDRSGTGVFTAMGGAGTAVPKDLQGSAWLTIPPMAWSGGPFSQTPPPGGQTIRQTVRCSVCRPDFAHLCCYRRKQALRLSAKRLPHLAKPALLRGG